MIEFFITSTRTGYELTANGAVVGIFGSDTEAADMAVRFAQDTNASSYRIFY